MSRSRVAQARHQASVQRPECCAAATGDRPRLPQPMQSQPLHHRRDDPHRRCCEADYCAPLLTPAMMRATATAIRIQPGWRPRVAQALAAIA